MTFSIIAFFLIAAVAIVMTIAAIAILFQAGRGVGFLVGHVFEFIFGMIRDIARILGAIIASIVLAPLAILNLLIGRWSTANHFADGVKREILLVGKGLYRVAVRRPLKLLFLDGLLEGVEVRAVEDLKGAPGRDQPGRGLQFPGFEITGSLPAGGSGAKLYIARPDERTQRRLPGQPDVVVIKSFALADGSSLPQIVRESRSLDSAKRLGLVLAHELNDTQFWYAMPYHPGDHLGAVVRETHAVGTEDGLRGRALAEMLGYEIDLVSTLDRYHRDGLWHKDVKPDNIIVHDGGAHLVDFGLVTSLRSAMTLTTHGTEYFRDPEMVRMAMRGVKVHEVNGAKFDIYGAGAVLYFIMENTFPGHGGLSRFERPAPESLRWIVRRAMADYGQRYESALEMLDDLRFVASSANPWSITPAQLPSMTGANVELVDADGVIDPAATSPPPSPSVRRTAAAPPPLAGTRPNIRVTNWMTGAYASAAQGERPRAREQVAAARRRVSTRRASVPRSPHLRISGTLVALVATGTAFFLAFVLSWGAGAFDGIVGRFDASRASSAMQIAIDDVREDMLERGAIESSYEIRLQRGTTAADEWTAPSPVGTGSFIVLDDRTSLSEGEASMEQMTRSLTEAGWTIVADLDLVAESAVAIARCQGRSRVDGDFSSKVDFDCEGLDSFRLQHGVEAILWITTMRDAAASTVIEGTTLVRGDVIRAVLFAEEAVEVSIDILPYIEVMGLWPDGTQETVQVLFQDSSVAADSELRLDFDATLNEVLNEVKQEVQNELQEAMQEIGSELDQSETRFQEAYEQLNQIPGGVHIRTGPLKIRIAA